MKLTVVTDSYDYKEIEFECAMYQSNVEGRLFLQGPSGIVAEFTPGSWLYCYSKEACVKDDKA